MICLIVKNKLINETGETIIMKSDKQEKKETELKVKKTYTPPKIISYGDVAELTQSGSSIKGEHPSNLKN